MDIFVPIRFRTSIQLSPADLVADFEEVILRKVRSSLEGVCSRFGYIRPGSITISKRSVGYFVKQHFNGHIKFDMICKADVCNPSVGSVFKAVVKNKNALGVHAESVIDNDATVLDIIIPRRSVGIVSSVNLDNIEVGNTIFVEVLGKRYQLNDTKISIIGRAINEPASTSSLPEAVDDVQEMDEVLDDDIPPLEAYDGDQFVDGEDPNAEGAEAADADGGEEGEGVDNEAGDDDEEDEEAVESEVEIDDLDEEPESDFSEDDVDQDGGRYDDEY